MSNQKETTPDSYVVKEFLINALSYKYLYIAFIVVCLSVAFVLNKISPTVYGVNSIIGPLEDERPSLLGSNNFFSNAEALSQVRNLENDIASLSSFSLVSQTLKEMNLEISYYSEKTKILKKSQQIYSSVPFTVNLDKSHIQPINVRIYIKIIDGNSYRIRSAADDVTLYNYVDNLVVSEHNKLQIDTICKFNETVTSKYYKLSVFLNRESYSGKTKEEDDTYFILSHQDLLASHYLKKLEVDPVSLKSSLIKVSFHGENRELTIDFLNRYLRIYLDDNLSKKNAIAKNTVNFIESQISEISDSLLKSESKLKDFRSANQVTDLSYQGQQALQEMTRIEAEKSALAVQEHYYNYILDYFDKNSDGAGLAPPSSANVVDPIMNSLVTEFINLNSQKSTIISTNTGKNLFLGQLEAKIKLQRETIIENVRNSLNTLNLTQNELNYRSEKLSREISKLPRTELNMVSMKRKFDLSDAIYTFLLQKRSEADITMASNIPDYEILEPARQTSSVVLSPRKKLNYALALFLAILFPTSFIVIKNFFNEKITRIHDVEVLLNRPVLSIIYSNHYKSEAVVRELPGSPIAESFRNLRSTIFLRCRPHSLKVIGITSSQPQDGKSFISFNLAASIASVGYKTVILDCDLRRPTLHEKFKNSNSNGLSTYMVNKSTIDDIIHKTEIKNLFFIPAGPVLPNSAELIESGAMDDLINYLKSTYEYLIIDTTPAGLVADAALLMKYANINLLVCRNNYTRKDVFRGVLSMLKANRIDNFDVVFNDVNLKKSLYGRYNSYYTKDKML
jgi:capsular exopolysaccharide synthesis family protein